MDKRLLITGGAGFIGSNAARHFMQNNWSVTLFDNFFRKGAEQNVAALQRDFPGIRVVKGDICRDFELLQSEIRNHSSVLHLAAQVAVTTSLVDPRTDFEKNALGTFNVLEAIRSAPNPPAIIYSSTNKVYGGIEEKTVRETETRYEFNDDEYRTYGVPETQPLDFHSPYGCSKGAADQYVVDYSRIYGLKTLVFRQSCIYGPHQFGIEDQGWVAWFTIAVMHGKPLTLFGTGKQVRDVLFVEDLVNLYRLGFEKINEVSGRAYNVGGGPQNTLSLLELLELLHSEFGYSPQTSFAKARPGDQPIFVADIRRVSRDLGWTPAASPKRGIARMHKWLQENQHLLLSLLKN
jgi:CDP-paratose 2-epimerase